MKKTIVVLPWFNHMVNNGFTMVNHMVELQCSKTMVRPWFNHGIFGRPGDILNG